MNVYDFDETIYDGDSTRDFVLFLLKRQPSLLRHLPQQFAALTRYASGELSKTQFKESYYYMFKNVKGMDEKLQEFWARHIHRVKPFYHEQKRPDDLIISASPAFLLEPACARLGVTHLIASDVDATCGLYAGENCYGSEKVHRFLAAGYDPDAVESFYSDSCSDFPLAELAESAYIVRGDIIGPWEKPVKYGMSAFFHHFNDRNFLLGLIIGAAQFIGTIVFSLLAALWLPMMAAFVLGMLVSLGLAFVLNSRLRQPLLLRLREQIKLVVVPQLPSFIIQCASLIIFRRFFRLPKGLSIVFAAIFGLPITYVSLRHQRMKAKKET